MAKGIWKQASKDGPMFLLVKMFWSPVFLIDKSPTVS